jgi:hypothetical protein
MRRCTETAGRERRSHGRQGRAKIAAAATLAGLALVLVSADALAQARGGALRPQRRITFNGAAPDVGGWRVIEQLEAMSGTRLPDGHYWYDGWSGAAGRWGGPAATLLLPGLPLGGRLPADASGGGYGRLTGVFVNGRELHPQDVRALIALYGQVWPGRWWVNGLGDFGPEGGPAIGNLRRAAEAMRGGSWLRGGGTGSSSFWTGGDGNGYVWAMDGYSGCSYASDGGGVIC